MKRILLSVLAALLSAVSSIAVAGLAGDWKLHFPFEREILKVEDTPGRVYMMSYSQLVTSYYVDNLRPWATIHYLDKATGEMKALERRGRTFGAKARLMAYNHDKGYLMVIYDNLEVDMVYDDGRTVTITDLAELNNMRVPEPTRITFDTKGNRACLATSLGYALFNDETCVMEEYRDYDHALLSAVTFGDLMLFTYNGHLRFAPLSEPRLAFEDYKVLYSNYIRILLPLTDDLIGYVREQDGAWRIATLQPKGDTFATKEIHTGIERMEITRTADGYIVPMQDYVGFLDFEGNWTRHEKAEGEKGCPAASYDGREIWFAGRHTGLWSSNLADGQWTPGHPPTAPDAPSSMQVTEMIWHPRYGVLAPSRGITHIYTNLGLPQPLELSGYRAGSWSHYGFDRRNPSQSAIFYNPTGIAVDPDRPEYVYMGSPRQGVLRLNLEDPEDILHMSGPRDAGKDLPGYVEAFPMMERWKSVCSTTEAQMDSDGNLWVFNFDLDQPNDCGLSALCWTAEARRASEDAESFRPWTRLRVPGIPSSASAHMCVLTHPNNRNLLIFAVNSLNHRYVVVDHNGTPEDPSDDRMAVIKEMRDQFGNVISLLNLHCRHLMEDPQTGLVWVSTEVGTYMFNPRTMFVDPTRARRVITTDPESGLETLLADGLAVNTINCDTQGRKWVATLHDGVYCTSPDGSETLAHFHTGNSPIPSDNVLTVCENRAAGTIMIATDGGMAEFIPSLTEGRPSSVVTAVPGAITPSYRGPVTIGGLADGEEYAVADASGRAVRSMGCPDGGRLQWDGRDASGAPVAPGIYSVVATSRPDVTLTSVRVIR